MLSTNEALIAADAARLEGIAASSGATVIVVAVGAPVAHTGGS